MRLNSPTRVRRWTQTTPQTIHTSPLRARQSQATLRTPQDAFPWSRPRSETNGRRRIGLFSRATVSTSLVQTPCATRRGSGTGQVASGSTRAALRVPARRGCLFLVLPVVQTLGNLLESKLSGQRLKSVQNHSKVGCRRSGDGQSDIGQGDRHHYSMIHSVQVKLDYMLFCRDSSM